MSILSWDEYVKHKQGEYEITINPADLKLGDYVVHVEAVGPWLNFPAAGLAVETFEQKLWFRTNTRRVVIDLKRCLHRQADHAVVAASGTVPQLPRRIDALRRSRLEARGVVEAWRVYRELSLCSQALILSFSRHGQIDIDGAREACSQLVDALGEQMAALVWLTRIKESARYSYQHGLNVAVLAAAFAKALGWSRRQVEEAALAGLLHDLGMTRLSLRVLNKTEPLDEREIAHIRIHTRLGYELLAQNERVPPAVAEAVLCHHERPDGHGYPGQLTIEKIPLLARLIAVIDAYDAIGSERPHRRARSHQEALGVLWRERGGQFDKTLVEGFSQFLGWAPPGTLLRLANGDLAVALNTAENAARPLVRKLRKTAEGIRLGVEIDLASGALKAVDAVDSVLPDGVSGIDLRELTRQLPRALMQSETQQRAEGGEPPAEAATGLGRVLGVGQPRERRRRPRVDAPRGTRILVVDDSPTVRKTLANMLGQAGYEIELAETGEAGLELAFLNPPDLLFLDIVLPDFSGFTALRRLRREHGTENVPVVMISGNARAADDFFVQRIGADDFIHKPFGRFEVFSCIERLIRAGSLPQRPGQASAVTAQPAQ